MVDTANSSFFKDNGLSDRAFTIFDLFITGLVDSEAKRNYQNTKKNIWIFNIKFNIYVCNSLKGFIKTKNSDKTIKAGATPHAI